MEMFVNTPFALVAGSTPNSWLSGRMRPVESLTLWNPLSRYVHPPI